MSCRAILPGHFQVRDYAQRSIDEGSVAKASRLEVRKFCSGFMGHSDILQLFDRLRSLQNFSLHNRKIEALIQRPFRTGP
jgi:hypothetical protein